MPKTNYKNCWWLIQAINGEFGTGSYLKGRGYSLRNLNDLKSPGERVKYDWFSRNENAIRERDSFRHEIMRHRAIIYNEFGLAIRQKSDSGVDLTKGNGGYFYFLDNPELLDDNSKTLRDHIKFLADSEKDRESWMTLNDMEEKFRESPSTMGFISTGGSASRGYLSKSNTTPRIILGEENLPLVQFAMEFGEVLTIKFGKVKDGVDINAPYSFEPYQVKEIEGRWYAIGNLYPMGHKESAELAIYDLTRLVFAYDEENPDLFYEPIKGFDIYENMQKVEGYEWPEAGVIRLKLITRDISLTSSICDYPFSAAQEEVITPDDFLEGFQVYVRLSMDLIIQLGAYGEELKFELLPFEGQRDMDLDRIRQMLNCFRTVCEQ